MTRKHPNPRPQNHQEGGQHHECKRDGNTRVSGEIEVRLQKDLLEQHNAEQKESTSHNKTQRLIGWLTLGIVFLYTTITAFQWWATNNAVKAAREANRLLEESTRGRLSIDWKLGPIEVGSPVRAEVTITNVGHSLATVGTHYGYDRRVELPDGGMPLDAGPVDTMLDAGKDEVTTAIDPQPVTKDFLDNLPTIKDSSPWGSLHSPTIYLYGRIDYETLAGKHKLEFCSYLIQNDPNVMPFDSPLKESKFILRTCPKWNSSN